MRETSRRLEETTLMVEEGEEEEIAIMGLCDRDTLMMFLLSIVFILVLVSTLDMLFLGWVENMNINIKPF